MLLLRGATGFHAEYFRETVSIHAPLARSNFTPLCERSEKSFQYMLLLRGATRKRTLPCRSSSSFNTCSSCEEQLPPVTGDRRRRVSIHAPLARSNWKAQDGNSGKSVSIHAPLARSNLSVVLFADFFGFQYMLLLRGATGLHKTSNSRSSFNTCSSCEEQPEGNSVS